MEELKFCRKCNAWKPISEFYKDTRGGCRACVRKYQNAWSMAHRVHKRPTIPEGMRLCKRCGEMKSQDEFYRDKTNVSGYHHYCKICTDSSRKARREKAKKPKSILPEGHKRCPGCKRILSLEKFSYLKTRRCYKSRCKDCEREYKKTHRDQINSAERKRFSDPETKATRLAYRKEWRGKPEAKAKETAYRKEYKKRDYVKAKDYARNAEYRQRPGNAEKAKERTTEWIREHPEEVRQQHRIRYARKKGADGSYTHEQWLKLLELCGNKCLVCGSTERLTRDHIIPLKWGGSNNIENLQVLCHKHNTSKKASSAVDYRPLPARAWAYLETYGTVEEWASYIVDLEVEVQA